jgi:hypothetical protein
VGFWIQRLETVTALGSRWPELLEELRAGDIGRAEEGAVM